MDNLVPSPLPAPSPITRMQPKSTDLHLRHRQLGADQALVQEERTLLTLQQPTLPVYHAVGRVISVEFNELKI